MVESLNNWGVITGCEQKGGIGVLCLSTSNKDVEIWLLAALCATPMTFSRGRIHDSGFFPFSCSLNPGYFEIP